MTKQAATNILSCWILPFIHAEKVLANLLAEGKISNYKSKNGMLWIGKQ